MMTSSTLTETATVAVLTAEVRVLQVGRRQITQSVYRQLDRVEPAEIEPFGRVGPEDEYAIAVVGRCLDDGALVGSRTDRRPRLPTVDVTDLIVLPHNSRNFSQAVWGSARPVDYLPPLIWKLDDAKRCSAGCRECAEGDGWHWRSPEACVAAVRRSDAARAPHRAIVELTRAWTELPLIVLAGLR